MHHTFRGAVHNAAPDVGFCMSMQAAASCSHAEQACAVMSIILPQALHFSPLRLVSRAVLPSRFKLCECVALVSPAEPSSCLQAD